MYGSAHADCGDSASATTAMTCLTEPHPDAMEDIFFIQDFAVAIVIEEWDTVYFCGARFHGGSQPRYLPRARTDMWVYVRLTLISYAPTFAFDVPSSEAFISIPTKEGVAKIFTEMRDYR